MGKFLLLLGPSGCGKSSAIQVLRQIDERYTYISPFMTRPLREGEKDKVFISEEEMTRLESEGGLLAAPNIKYSIKYGTPRQPILDAFEQGAFPTLDWPVEKISIMIEAFSRDRLYIVYVAPPSIEELSRRLKLDARDTDGSRLADGINEWQRHRTGEFDNLIDMTIISEPGEVEEVARTIHESYLKSCNID